MSERSFEATFEFNVGFDEKTLKWHAFYMESPTSRMQGPARDTPGEAASDGEKVLKIAREQFSASGFEVGDTQRIQ